MSKRKRRRDGRFAAYVFMGYNPDGTEKREYVYAYSEKELEDKLFDLKMHVAKGEFVDNDKMTVAEWADIWLKTYKKNKEYKTYQMYDITLRDHIVKELGHLRLVDLKPFHIQNLINDRYEKGLTKTLKNIKQTINQMLEQAVENDLLVKNPAKKVELPSIEKEPKRALTKQEIELIEKADLTLKERAFVYICMYAGLRRGEALALTKNDIKDDKIRINKSLVYKNNQPIVKNCPKTDAGFREVPMVDKLRPVIEAYANSINGIYLFQRETSAGLMTESAFRSMWTCILRKLNKAAGGNYKVLAISKITPHMLRHTYSTMLYYAGIDIKMAQYLMGHASIETTLTVYTHLDQQESAAIDKLNNYLTVSKRCQSSADDNL
jgi:integrase